MTYPIGTVAGMVLMVAGLAGAILSVPSLRIAAVAAAVAIFSVGWLLAAFSDDGSEGPRNE